MANHNDVGKDTEQRLARYFRAEGWTGAERAVRTGFRIADRTVADTGDLTGMPGLCVQSKSLRPATRAEVAVPTWLRETEAQRVAGRAVLGLLVVRRWGTTDVGRWWCFLDLEELHALQSGQLGTVGVGGWNAPDYQPTPVRLELRDVVTILRAQGWGADDAAVAG